MSTHVTGQIETMLAALDEAPDHPAVAAITVGDDQPPKVARFSAPVREYVRFRTAGVELLFENLRGERGNRALAAVLIRHDDDAEDEPGFAAYPDSPPLIDGLDLRRSTRADVRGVLGEPYRGEGSELYRIQDDRVIHIQFDNEHEDPLDDVMWKVQVMARDVRER